MVQTIEVGTFLNKITSRVEFYLHNEAQDKWYDKAQVHELSEELLNLVSYPILGCTRNVNLKYYLLASLTITGSATRILKKSASSSSILGFISMPFLCIGFIS